MPTEKILKASAIITMDPQTPRAEAVAFDIDSGKIIAVGTLAHCQAASPAADVLDLGSTVLMPGFVEPHSHPFSSGVVTQDPAYWIAPYVGFPTWDDVQALFRKAHAEVPAGQALIFNGLDRLLQQAPVPTADLLDSIFGERAVCIADNSGHAVYFNTATMALAGWKDATPPADPPAGSFGRNADGTSNGVAFELPAMMVIAAPMMAAAIAHPLHSAALWYVNMAKYGITSTAEMTYSTDILQGYLALTSVPDCPLRMALYHMSTEADANDSVASPFPAKLAKHGVKLWADGSPWVGNIATSFPYLDTPEVREAQIPIGPQGEKAMNYTREQLDAVLDKYGTDWQMAIHCNGDVAADIVLDAFEAALTRNGRIGTDHRWRMEHLGGLRKDQFERAASLGITCSMSPFQYIYWGDLMDGTMFAPEIGSQWQKWRDAFDAGVRPSFHNDGSVSPPDVLLNIQSTVTRTTDSGKIHGANQAITLDEALQAVTVNGAYQLHRDHEIGSIAAGKYADFVELSKDIYTVDPLKITEEIDVQGTWLGGRRINLTDFVEEVRAIDPTEHAHLAKPDSHSC